MTRHPNVLFLLAAGLLGLSACDKVRPLLGLPDPGMPKVPTGDPSGGPDGPTAPIRIAHCTPCHGTPGLELPNADPLVSAAPPKALLSDVDPGAHRAHLVDGPFRRAVECASCHLVPTEPPPHPAQKQGKVSFSRLATTSWSGAPLQPAWNGTTCAGTYCHGNFKNGANAAPAWSGSVVMVCGSCHAVSATNGAGGTHPTYSNSKNCGSCHGGAYTNTTVDLALHMNGVVDAPNVACSTCHGDDTRLPVPSATATDPTGANLVKASPPLDAGHGLAATGAHLAHVNQGDTAAPGPLSDAIACTTCHPVPSSVAHSNGTVNVAFGGLATTGGAAPAPYAFATHTCASTYCHGNFAGGAGANAIAWTGTSKLGCASCHGAPPGPTSATVHHPPNPGCSSCHTGYTATTVAAATHVNGAVDHTPATGCTQCHGDLTAAGVASTDVRAAPASDANAVDAHGNPATATTLRGVGAHGKHLTGTAWRASPIACPECHAVPASGDTAHANGNPLVTFGSLASTAWAGQPAITPVWNGAGGGATLTCSSTYCHGNFKNAAASATNATPTWTAAGSVVCGSCHGVSATTGPGGTHPTFSAGQNCGSCHGGAYTNTAVDPAMHMNGVLDVPNLTCSTCHGDSARVPVASATTLDALGANLVKASPPADAGGGAAATGAHLAHLNQGDAAPPGPLSNALACSSCHPVPTSPGHSNGTVSVAFGGLATTGGATPAPYAFATHTCASTYCHGSFAGGAGANAIAWTGTSKLGCASCHGAPPGPTSATVHHPPNPSCSSCHTGYTSTTVAAATHVNGTIEHTPATGCTQCHGDTTLSAVANTDVRAAPASDANAVDAHGNPATATTVRGVGAHGKHLTGTAWRASPIACSECHAVPANGDAAHANGNPLITFGSLASTAWAGQPPITPVWNGAGGGATLTCSSTYCHGAFKNAAASATNPAPTWTAPGSVVCGSCHGVSATNGPGGTHPTLGGGQNCGTCHGGSYTNTSVDPALHMNGVLDGGGESTGGASCSGCHGTIFAAMNGGVSHTSRHALGNVAGTNDAPTDSGISWANPLSSNAPAARSCVNMCHGDHPHDLTSPATATHENNAYADATSAATRADGTANRIGVGGTGGSVNRMKTDFDAAQANGGLCASCHQSAVDAARPAVDRAAFDASAHDYASNTVGATTYSWSYALHDGGLFARDCTKCHASRVEGTTPQVTAAGSATVAVHFGDDESLLAGAKNPAGTAAGFVCYNCHGSAASPAAGAQGNRSGKDIQSGIAHATTAGQSGHPANADSVHDTVAEFANAAFGNALGVAAGAGQRHASCLDCHDPHKAKAGTHAQGTNVAGPPLQGAWGAKWTGTLAAWGTPTSANLVKTAIVAGTDLEATLCFKCHSAYYGTLPTSPSGAFTETDQAREFNPANPSFHPVLASASGNQGATSNIIAPWTRTSLMTCTDCHESSATTDPNGPHGSAARFILKGPNTSWSSTVTNTSGGMPAGTFCANCHNANFANSRFPGHTNGNHNIACMGCHVAIPHGSGHIGMLVSLPGGAGGNAVTDSAPYTGATVRLGIGSYPAATANWANSNCGCGSVSNGH
ncbi:MAG TPA: CxxxxCH/CxxCH domain-containing protein [Anaeromyxobacter sp.]